MRPAELAEQIIAERGVITGRQLREEVNERLPWWRRKGLVGFYHMMRNLEDAGIVVQFRQERVIGGSLLETACFRLSIPSPADAVEP